MKVKGNDLINGIKKSRGVVEDSMVIEYLRGFRFNPRQGLVNIAGSDGRMTLLATIPYEETDSSDNSILSIPSDKIQELVKYIKADDEVEFKYSEDKDNVEITVNNYVLKTHKKEFENELIDFSMVQETEFDDKVDLSELVFVIESLINVLVPDDPDLVYQTIYFDGKYAYAFTGDVYVKIKFETKHQYQMDHRIARQVLVVLKNTEGEHVYLKNYEESGQIMIKTESDLLIYRLMDDEIYEVDVMDDFKGDLTLKLKMNELVNAIFRTSLGSDDGDINLKAGDKKLILNSMTETGEIAYDEVKIVELKGEPNKDDLSVLYSTLVKLCKAIRESEIEIDFDMDNNILRIRDESETSVGFMTFE